MIIFKYNIILNHNLPPYKTHLPPLTYICLHTKYTCHHSHLLASIQNSLATTHIYLPPYKILLPPLKKHLPPYKNSCRHSKNICLHTNILAATQITLASIYNTLVSTHTYLLPYTIDMYSFVLNNSYYYMRTNIFAVTQIKTVFIYIEL